MAEGSTGFDAILDKVFEGDKENARLFSQKIKLRITGILYDSNMQPKNAEAFHKAIDGHSHTVTLLRHGIVSCNLFNCFFFFSVLSEGSFLLTGALPC